MTKFKDIVFGKNIAIHCPEEWMANELLKYADSMGYKWWAGHKYTDYNNWEHHKKDIAYYIERGVYSSIHYANKINIKVLHYNDVVIKEGEKMETKLDYELWIKGRRAKIGSELWDRHGNKTIIIGIFINKESEAYIRCLNADKGTTNNLKMLDVGNFLFWEKQTIYQLPDTEGNLSEVKIGQKVYNNILLDWGKIIEFYDNAIIIEYSDNISMLHSIRVLNDLRFKLLTTNKPSRFKGKQDWSQAPKKAVAWTIDRDGHAWWWENRPYSSTDAWDGDWGTESAGYRNDLINDRKNMRVTDWKDSLVMRPKGE